MKPGYQTTEFWMTLAGQVLALCVVFGVVKPADREHLETTLTTAITAIFSLVASAATILQYIRSRTGLKQRVLATGTPPPAQEQGPMSFTPVAVLFVLLLAAGPAAAQQQPACWWNRQRGTDPAILQLLQQISMQQQQILALLQRQQAPQPQYIVLGGPLQQIPLGGPPRQDIPLGGPPRQDIPLGGPPRQDIPLGPPPRQDLPLGPAPRQDIPLEQPKPMPKAGTLSYQRYSRLKVDSSQ